MSPLLERLFVLLLSERLGSTIALPLFAAAEGLELPEDFACVTATDPAAPGEGLPGITHTLTLSICCPIARRSEAEALASAYLELTLSEIAAAACAQHTELSAGHLYAWAPGLSTTEILESNRLALTATAELTCARIRA